MKLLKYILPFYQKTELIVTAASEDESPSGRDKSPSDQDVSPSYMTILTL